MHGRRAPAKEGDVREMLGGKGYSGGQEWDWMNDLEEDLKAFGIKFEAWRETAQMVPTARKRGGGFRAEMSQG